MLSTVEIRAAYRKKEILRGVCLRVDDGEVVALVGTNGSGKSTLLRVIAGLLRPQGGHVVFDGHEITGYSPHRINRRGITCLLQGGKVFSELTVKENLEMANHCLRQDESVKGDSHVVRIFPALEELMRRRAGLLSGGERQMLAIAMVLAQAPRLMLLDEPTAALAPVLVGDVLNRLREHSRQTGCSVLLVEQNVRQAVKVADRTYSLTNGVATEEPRDRQWERFFTQAAGVVE